MRLTQSKTHNTPHSTNANSKKPNVGIITHPFLARAGVTPLDNMIAVARPLANRLFVITGGDYNSATNGVEIIRIKATRRASFVSRVLEQVFVHARFLRVLLRL